jgi:aminobenzoyl-glutamate transport protein
MRLGPARSVFFKIFISYAGVEWLGSLLPHPVTLFALSCVAVLKTSGIAGYFEGAVADPRP